MYNSDGIMQLEDQEEDARTYQFAFVHQEDSSTFDISYFINTESVQSYVYENNQFECFVRFGINTYFDSSSKVLGTIFAQLRSHPHSIFCI
jgi:hypothetical protein